MKKGPWLWVERRLLAVAVFSLLGLLAGAAFASRADAEVRSLSIADPVDAPPTVSGVPSNPDITQFSVNYDTSGSITITITFANALNALDLSEDYAEWGDFVVSTGDATPGESDALCDNGAPGSIQGQNQIASSVETFTNEATVVGFTGELPFNWSESPDGHQIVLNAASPAIANQNYTCAGYEVFARVHASAEDPASDYDASCDCWYDGATLDSAPDDALGWGAWFDGFAPSPAPAPSPTPAPTPVPAPKPKPKPKSHPPVQKPLPAMTLKAATSYSRTALLRHVRKVQRLRGQCRKRANGRRQNCTITFHSGKRRWRGMIDVWYARGPKGKLLWKYSMRIAGRLPSCHRARCVQHKTVR